MANSTGKDVRINSHQGNANQTLAKGEKPDTKGQILCDFMTQNLQNRQIHSHRKYMRSCQGLVGK